MNDCCSNALYLERAYRIITIVYKILNFELSCRNTTSCITTVIHDILVGFEYGCTDSLKMAEFPPNMEE
jgi:hypothetical protein